MSHATAGRSRRCVIGIGLSLLLTAAGLTGCGDDDDGTVDASERGDVTATTVDDGPAVFSSPGYFVVGSSDPCTLLEPSEIEEQFGGPVSAGATSGLTCRWTVGQGPPSATSGTIDLSVTKPPPGTDFEDAWAEVVESMGDEGGEFDWLGDRAVSTMERTAFSFGRAIIDLRSTFTPRQLHSGAKVTELCQRLIIRLGPLPLLPDAPPTTR